MNWLSLLNVIVPAATNLILLIKDESGSTTAIISSTLTSTQAEIQQIQLEIMEDIAAKRR